MRYIRVADAGPFGEFGEFGAWYDVITIDRQILGNWARALDPSLPADNDAVIARIAQTPEQGGGFVAGNIRMCPSNVRGGHTEPLRSADQPCPPGSGGISGEQVREISAEEVHRINEENKRREREERTRPAETVEVTGSVQKAGRQELRSVTISSGMTGFTHPTFGREPGGEPLPNLIVEVDGQSARTDNQGRFTIRGQAPGVVTGVVRDLVGKGQEAVLVVIGVGSAVTDSAGSFRVPLHVAELHGRVVDGLGRTVGGATVEIEVDPAYRSGRFDGYFDAAVVAPGASALTDASGIYYGIPYSVRSSAYVAATVRTNAAGMFSVRVPTGNYAVKVRADGFAERRQGGIFLGIGATMDVGNVMLIPSPTALPGGGSVPGGGTPGEGGVSKTEPSGAAGQPWYKSTWLWIGVATVAAGGMGYLIWRQRKGR